MERNILKRKITLKNHECQRKRIIIFDGKKRKQDFFKLLFLLIIVSYCLLSSLLVFLNTLKLSSSSLFRKKTHLNSSFNHQGIFKFVIFCNASEIEEGNFSPFTTPLILDEKFVINMHTYTLRYDFTKVYNNEKQRILYEYHQNFLNQSSKNDLFLSSNFEWSFLKEKRKKTNFVATTTYMKKNVGGLNDSTTSYGEKNEVLRNFRNLLDNFTDIYLESDHLISLPTTISSICTIHEIMENQCCRHQLFNNILNNINYTFSKFHGMINELFNDQIGEQEELQKTISFQWASFMRRFIVFSILSIEVLEEIESHYVSENDNHCFGPNNTNKNYSFHCAEYFAITQTLTSSLMINIYNNVILQIIPVKTSTNINRNDKAIVDWTLTEIDEKICHILLIKWTRFLFDRPKQASSSSVSDDSNGMFTEHYPSLVLEETKSEFFLKIVDLEKSLTSSIYSNSDFFWVMIDEALSIFKTKHDSLNLAEYFKDHSSSDDLSINFNKNRLKHLQLVLMKAGNRRVYNNEYEIEKHFNNILMHVRHAVHTLCNIVLYTNIYSSSSGQSNKLVSWFNINLGSMIIESPPHWTFSFSGIHTFKLKELFEGWYTICNIMMTILLGSKDKEKSLDLEYVNYHQIIKQNLTHGQLHLIEQQQTPPKMTKMKMGEKQETQQNHQDTLKPYDEKKKIRVGFLSSWYNPGSAIGKFFIGILKNLNRESILFEGIDQQHFENQNDLNYSSFSQSSPFSKFSWETEYEFEVIAIHLVLNCHNQAERNQILQNREELMPYIHKYIVLGCETEDSLMGDEDIKPLQNENKSPFLNWQNSLHFLHMDTLIFVDIGMNTLSYSLALERYAPYQIVFWGHPITSGIKDSIDYYIIPDGSENENFLYISDSLKSSSFSYQKYTEQLIRFQTLGIHYPSNKVPSEDISWNSCTIEDSTTLDLNEFYSQIDNEWPLFSRYINIGNNLLFSQNKYIFHQAKALLRLYKNNLDFIPFITHNDTKELAMNWENRHNPNISNDSSPPNLYGLLQHCDKMHPHMDILLLKLLARDPNAIIVMKQCKSMIKRVKRFLLGSVYDTDRKFFANSKMDNVMCAQNDTGNNSVCLEQWEKNIILTQSTIINNDLFQSFNNDDDIVNFWMTSRFIFLPAHFGLSLGHFQLLLASMDINLESFPFPATITSLDSLLVDTPVMSWTDSFLGRQYGFSQLTQGIYSNFKERDHVNLEKNETEEYEEKILMTLLSGNNLEDYLKKAMLVANNDHIRCKISKFIMKQKGPIFNNLLAVEEWRKFLVSINK